MSIVYTPGLAPVARRLEVDTRVGAGDVCVPSAEYRRGQRSELEPGLISETTRPECVCVGGGIEKGGALEARFRAVCCSGGQRQRHFSECIYLYTCCGCSHVF